VFLTDASDTHHNVLSNQIEPSPQSQFAFVSIYPSGPSLSLVQSSASPLVVLEFHKFPDTPTPKNKLFAKTENRINEKERILVGDSWKKEARKREGEGDKDKKERRKKTKKK